MTEIQPLKNIHEILTLSAQEPKEEAPMPTMTFRTPLELRTVAEQIAKQNGSSLPALFRQAMRELVRDYRP